MKIVQKLTIAYFVGACAVLAVNGAARVRREVALFEANALREHRALATVVRSSVLAVWRTEGRDAAIVAAEAADRAHGRIRCRFLPIEDAPAIARAATTPITFLDPDRRATYVVIDGPNDRAALELTEDLDEAQRYVRKTAFDTLMTTLALIVVMSAIALVLSNWIVARPVRKLVAKARALGEDEPPVELPGRDELTLLAGELNATSERLSAARARIVAETSARIAALEQLRHAERLSTVGKLASGIAHELGTPLNVITGRADMIAAGEVTDDEARRSARAIAECSRRVTTIVRQLLGFARRGAPERVPVDLRSVVTHTTELLRPIAEQRGAQLDVAAGGPVVARVDPMQLQQALTNLVINALQAVPRGGHVAVAVSTRADGPTITVADDGPGIAPEHVPMVFDPFFTTKPVGDGTGLGLSVAHGIVADHGGTIAVESTPGEGTVFTIQLAHDGELQRGAPIS